MSRLSKRFAKDGPHPFAFLSTWRERKSLTQAQVALHFSVTSVTIHRWETGKAPITVQNFLLLAELYDAQRPDALLFPPGSVSHAKLLHDADNIICAMSKEDIEAWFAMGYRLSGRRQSVQETEREPQPATTK